MHVSVLLSQSGSPAVLRISAPARQCKLRVVSHRSSRQLAECASDAVLSKQAPKWPWLTTSSWPSSAAIAAVATATMLLGFTDCPIAEAYNVRLQDVDSPQLKEGGGTSVWSRLQSVGMRVNDHIGCFVLDTNGRLVITVYRLIRNTIQP